MKEVNTTPGKYQVVRSENGCTVTQTLDNGQLIEDNVPAGESTAVFAFTSRIAVDDDSAVVREVFKLAPQLKLALLGVLGGNDGLPAGYTRVEWLESPYAGNQTYIPAYFYLGDLSRTQADSVKIKTVHRLTKDTAPVNLEVEGSIKNGGDASLGYFISGRPASFDPEPGENVAINTLGCGFDRRDNMLNYNLYNAGQGWDTVWHTQSIYVDAYKVIYADNAYKQVHNIVGAPVDFGDSSIYCFGYPNLEMYYYGCSRSGQKKQFKVWKNGILLFDLVPALSPTGAPCMFDRVSMTPYYNAGVGDFLYPGKEAEVSTFSLRRPITYAQLTEHGVCRLYRVPRGYNGTKAEYAMEHGFKPLVETEKPEEGYWTPRWTETEEEIVLEWIETEPHAEETYC